MRMHSVSNVNYLHTKYKCKCVSQRIIKDYIYKNKRTTIDRYEINHTNLIRFICK